MHGVVVYRGVEYAAPLNELSANMLDYFPVDPETWACMDERERKQEIIDRDKVCQLSGEPNCECHEIVTRGAMGLSALVPWNMICLTRENHDLIHRGILKIERFDPLDAVDGLVVSINGTVRRKSSIYFYSKPNTAIADKAHKARTVLDNFVEARKHNAWSVAEELYWLKENDAHTVLGEASYDSMLASIGMDLSLANSLRQTYKLAKMKGLLDVARNIHPQRASRIMRVVDDDNARSVMIDAAGFPTKRDFEDLLRNHRTTTRKSTRHYFVIDGDKKTMVEASDIRDMPGTIIVEGKLKRDVFNEVEEKIDESNSVGGSGA